MILYNKSDFKGIFPFQVIKSQVHAEYALIEVLPVKAIINGTAVTEVRFDQVSKGHRRKKRNISKKNLTFKKTYNTPYVKIPVSVKHAELTGNL